MINGRKVVVLCGPMRFKHAFDVANFQESLAGNMVLAPTPTYVAQRPITNDEYWAIEGLHRQKIMGADEVVVVSVGGYFGRDTLAEIEWALSLGKTIRYLESHE